MATAAGKEGRWWMTGLSWPRGRGHTRAAGEGLEREDEITLGTAEMLCSPGGRRMKMVPFLYS